MHPALTQQLFNTQLFIEQNLQEPLNAKDLADRAFLSYYHFEHQFKSFTGESLWKFVKRLRLEKAAFLSAHTSLPFSDIAYETGFGSSSALSKSFSQWFGLSPEKYRQRFLQTQISPTQALDWNALKEVYRPEEKIISFRAEGIQSFPKGYFQWMQLAESLVSKGVTLIGKSPDQPMITQQEKLRWDTAIPDQHLSPEIRTAVFQSPYVVEETLAAGRFVCIPFTGFGRPFAYHFSEILSHLHQQGLQWRLSGKPYQVLRTHASQDQCTTDLFIPVQ